MPGSNISEKVGAFSAAHCLQMLEDETLPTDQVETWLGRLWDALPVDRKAELEAENAKELR